MGGCWVDLRIRGTPVSRVETDSILQFSKLESLEKSSLRLKRSISVSSKLYDNQRKGNKKKRVQEIQYNEKHKVFLVEDYNNDIPFTIHRAKKDTYHRTRRQLNMFYL